MFEKIFNTRKAKPETPCDRLFVYGTLTNLHAVRDVWGVEPAKIEKATMGGSLYSADTQPIMLEGHGTVHGLLLTIPSMASDPRIFDKYEACHGNSPDSFHHRIQREATVESGEKVMAWVYVGNLKNRQVAKACVEKNLILQGSWTVKSPKLHGPLE